MIKAKIYQINDIEMKNIEYEQILCWNNEDIVKNHNLLEYIISDNFMREKNIICSKEKFLNKYFITFE